MAACNLMMPKLRLAVKLFLEWFQHFNFIFSTPLSKDHLKHLKMANMQIIDTNLRIKI